MAKPPDPKITSYSPPPSSDLPAKQLVALEDGESGDTFTFYDRLEIGRFREGVAADGKLLLKDKTISSRHCVVTQEEDGRCYVRDVSRNGTRLEGRRLSPNLKTEVKIGEVLSIGRHLHFRLEGDLPSATTQTIEAAAGTLAVSHTAEVTVLVGDIRDYTVLTQRPESSGVQESVNRVFTRLERGIEAHGGTLKEFQGDALFAFWEAHLDENHAAQACHAALAMNQLAKELAADPDVWQVEGFPLEMDWALATGKVAISSYGSGNALGLSMIGEPVVLAFRIEKFADDETGTIIACPATRELAAKEFEFRDLGTRQAKGFDKPQPLYSLVGER